MEIYIFILTAAYGADHKQNRLNSHFLQRKRKADWTD